MFSVSKRSRDKFASFKLGFRGAALCAAARLSAIEVAAAGWRASIVGRQSAQDAQQAAWRMRDAHRRPKPPIRTGSCAMHCACCLSGFCVVVPGTSAANVFHIASSCAAAKVLISDGWDVQLSVRPRMPSPGGPATPMIFVFGGELYSPL